ncbi:Glu-tRNA(Gln) amidotransferase subunit GatD [Candidatus Woesearchaeota archaeon]|nr:Glu-tRNA(Gln) amidotransferase subunit GatD [Candidatus Woesearchaeota archaeon]
MDFKGLKQGYKINVKTSIEVVEGILINDKKDILVLKLNNGYNIGIEKSNIRDIRVVEKSEMVSNPNGKKIELNKNLPKILILHTGGTIASRVDYKTGAVHASFEPEQLIEMFPELHEIANIDSVFIGNIWSDDLRFKHITLIAKEIEKNISKGYKGIIISMGTDNLAVGAAALSFAIENSNIPIIFVGAQRSSDRGSSDAGVNLVCAASFVCNSNYRGVAICMHSKSSDITCDIFSATKTKKLHTSRRDAFQNINTESIAMVDYKTGKVSMKQENYSSGEMKILPEFEDKVAILKIHINMNLEQFKFYKGYKGLIIEGTGLGQIPFTKNDGVTEEHEKIRQALKEVIESGTVVVMTSNCIFGRVNMDVYKPARELQELGVIPGEDMLTETAFVKLAWLLKNHPNQVKELIGKNICGEISSRTMYQNISQFN